MLARDLDVLDRDPNVDFVVMDFFGLVMSAHRVQNDYGVGQRHLSDLPDAGGERFIDAIAAHAQGATKPFFAIVSAAETEQEGLELRAVLRDAGILVFASAERAAAAYSNALADWVRRSSHSTPDRSAHQLRSPRAPAVCTRRCRSVPSGLRG